MMVMLRVVMKAYGRGGKMVNGVDQMLFGGDGVEVVVITGG